MGNEEIGLPKYTFKRASSVDISSIEDFTCGSDELDQKLIQMKSCDEGTTVVCIDESKCKIIGYCTYSTSGLTISYENDVVTKPSAEIKYFAIDKEYQHLSYNEDMNFSDFMLNNVISTLMKISETTISFEYILLYSVQDAVSFYERNGFLNFSDYMEKDSYTYINDCVPMFMEI